MARPPGQAIFRVVWVFDQASCKKASLGFLLGEGECPLVGDLGLSGSAQRAAEVGPCGVGEVVVGQVAAAQDLTTLPRIRPAAFSLVLPVDGTSVP